MSEVLRAPLGTGVGEGTPASPRLVVDIWPALTTAAGWRVLTLKRTPQRGGFWQGVSGRVETTDATIEAAARREIREETGLADGIEILDLGRWVEFTSPRSGLRFRKRTLGARLPAGLLLASVRLSEEHTEARLVTFEDARSLVPFPENRSELSLLESILAGGA
jgi:lipoyl(octanoyl) transferase